MNIQGMMVGNGATKWEVDVEPSFPETVRYFNIIPARMLDTFTANNCHYYFYPEYDTTEQSDICNQTWDDMNELAANLNWYDLYRPTYPESILTSNAKALKAGRQGHAMIDGKVKTFRRGMTMSEYTPWVKHLKATNNEVILGDYLSGYMNREDVRKVLHIPAEAPGWEMCSSTLEYHEQPEASYWIYGVLKNQVRKLFYSGDTDGAVTTYGSKRWIKDLKWSVDEAWRPWFTNGQVSGYVEKYDGLDFVTIKGVGHMAPQWARESTTGMIMAWIHNETF